MASGRNTVASRIIAMPTATSARMRIDVADRADHEAADHERQEEVGRDPEVPALVGPAVGVEEVGHREEQCGQGSESILRDG